MHRDIVIAVPMNEECEKILIERLKKGQWGEDAKLTFMHVFPIQSYAYMLPPHIYPNEQQKTEIRKVATRMMRRIHKDITGADIDAESDKETPQYVCLFHENPKVGAVEYLAKKKPDLVISATRGKHGVEGLFSSSFTDHLIKHAPCDVLALRPVSA